jgi:hypothetical protein
MLEANFIVFFIRTKDGVSEAIISADGIKVLCNNLYTDNENLQGICSIALSNYTHSNEGRRKLLYRQVDTFLPISILKFNFFFVEKIKVPARSIYYRRFKIL